MAAQTTNYGLNKPEYYEYVDIGVLNENFDTIDAALKALSGQGVQDFDNLLAHPSCIRTTAKNGSIWTEQIKTQGGSLRAERVTTIAAKDDITERYTFYAEDGATVSGKFTVHITKDAAGGWKEEVTKEASA